MRHLAPSLRLLLTEIARRYRLRQWIRALGRFGLALLWMALLLLVMLAAGSWVHLPPSIPAAIFACGTLYAAWRWLLAPFRQRIDLRQVALYIDEHHPELDNRILSAFDLSAEREMNSGESRPAADAFLVRKFFEEIDAIVPELTIGDLIDTRVIDRMTRTAALAWLAALLVCLVVQQVWFPVSFGGRTAADPAEQVAGAPTLEVKPGDARVRRGANQVVWVTSSAEDRSKTIAWRTAGGEWRTDLLQPSTSEDVHFHQYLDIQVDLEYRVHVGDQASPVYKIAVWTPPAVDAVDLTLRYPDYLETPDNDIPNGGDITAIEGTLADFDLLANKPLANAALVFDEGGRVELARGDGNRWEGTLTIERSDRYHIELLDEEGETNEYRPDFKVKALPDAPPKIKIAFPRGDGEATALEEMPFTFEVSDDYGLVDYGLEYNIPGREPVRLSLRDADAPAMKATGEHMLMLEVLDLAAGDLLTWSGYATDRKPGREEFETVGDPYFLEIRPFLRTYSEAVSNQGAQQANQQQNQPGREDVDQKQIIIATWNLRRQASAMDAEEFARQRDKIVEQQSQLRGRVGSPEAALPAGDGPRADVAGIMEKAIDALNAAEPPAPSAALSDALIHQQKAYREILKQKPTESRIVQTNQPGAGQNQGQNSREIDQLELDQRRDFFEEASTLDQQQEQAREILEDLRDLTKRQRVLNDEMAKLLSEAESEAERAEEEAQRRLERLREEQRRNLSQLDQIAGELAASGLDQGRTQEQLQQARGQMDRSAENLGQEQLQQARAAAGRALNSLSDAEQRIEQLSDAAAEQRLAQLRETMEALLAQQDEIVRRTDELQEQSDRPGLETATANEQATGELLEQKDRLSRELSELFQQADDLSEKAAESQELMARKIGEWLRGVGPRGLTEAIDQSKDMIRYGIWNAARAQERTVRDQLAQAAEGLEGIADFKVDSDVEAMQLALERLQGLLNDAEDADTAAAGGAPPRDGDAGTTGTQVAAAAGRPGEDPGQAGAFDAQPGDRQGNRQDGQQAGQQDGRQGGQQGGQRGGQQAGQRTGQRGNPPGDGQGLQPGDRAGGDRFGGRFGGDRYADGGGPWGEDRGTVFDGGGLRPDDARRLIESDYRRWSDALRDAQDLLPEENRTRGRVDDIRNEIDAMRRTFLRDGTIPDGTIVMDAVMQPLAIAEAELRKELERKLSDSEFKVGDEAAVPVQYAERVADYFKALSEKEPAR
jgi:hypothetical protein